MALSGFGVHDKNSTRAVFAHVATDYRRVLAGTSLYPRGRNRNVVPVHLLAVRWFRLSVLPTFGA